VNHVRGQGHARNNQESALESATRFRLCSSNSGPMKTHTTHILMILLALGPATARQEPTFSSQTNLVLVPTMVRDGKGDIVYGLHAQDFSIEDDGVQQAVHLDEAAEAVPDSLVIAVQTGRRAW
jgi:hypothetical protein